MFAVCGFGLGGSLRFAVCGCQRSQAGSGAGGNVTGRLVGLSRRDDALPAGKAEWPMFVR
jgi:hypothetical protein